MYRISRHLFRSIKFSLNKATTVSNFTEITGEVLRSDNPILPSVVKSVGEGKGEGEREAERCQLTALETSRAASRSNSGRIYVSRSVVAHSIDCIDCIDCLALAAARTISAGFRVSRRRSSTATLAHSTARNTHTSLTHARTRVWTTQHRRELHARARVYQSDRERAKFLAKKFAEIITSGMFEPHRYIGSYCCIKNIATITVKLQRGTIMGN